MTCERMRATNAGASPSRYGFMEQPDVGLALELCCAAGAEVEPMEATYFLSREKIVAWRRRAGRRLRLRDRMFAAMARNAAGISDFFRIPPNRVVELGTRVEF